jgi:hypothetical protein
MGKFSKEIKELSEISAAREQEKAAMDRLKYRSVKTPESTDYQDRAKRAHEYSQAAKESPSPHSHQLAADAHEVAARVAHAFHKGPELINHHKVLQAYHSNEAEAKTETIGAGKVSQSYKANQPDPDHSYKIHAKRAGELGKAADHFSDNEIKSSASSHEQAAEKHKFAANAHARAAEEAKDPKNSSYHKSKAHEHDTNAKFHTDKAADYKKGTPGGTLHTSEPEHEPLPHWLHHATSYADAKKAFRKKAMELHPDRETDTAKKAEKTKAFRDMHQEWEKAQKHPKFPKPTNEDIAYEEFLENFYYLQF